MIDPLTIEIKRLCTALLIARGHKDARDSIIEECARELQIMRATIGPSATLDNAIAVIRALKDKP